MLNYILKKAAEWLGDINDDQFKAIYEAIIVAAKGEDPGVEKFARVLDFALDKIWNRDVPDWIAQTVVQIIFAFARRKGNA